MLYRLKAETFIRVYDDIGYIVNKGNFSDQVTDKIGAIFLKSLSRRAKSIDEIVREISNIFIDADITEIKSDVESFMKNLEYDGFIVSGETIQELDSKDTPFSYSNINNNAITNEYELRSCVSSQKFLENYFKENPKLMSFQIEITSKCNERCIHCYIPHKNKDTDIDPELFYKILKQCKEMGVMDITLSGGEPMLHPNFLDFLHAAKLNDFSVTILSNLTLLTDEIISEMKSNCLSGVQVSLYSMNPDIHDSITKVPGSFEKTKQAIIKLMKNNIPIQISCPTMKQNNDESYSNVAKWATKNRLRAYTDCILMARYDHTTDNLDNRMSLTDMEKILNDIIENDNSYQTVIQNNDFNNINLQKSPDDIICGVGIMSLCMVSNGNVFPCAGWQSCVCGNVTKSSLKNIWETSPELNYLRKLRKKDLPKCANCENQIFCSVCMARNANENIDGNPLKINDYFCEIAKLNKKVVLEWQKKLQN